MKIIPKHEATSSFKWLCIFEEAKKIILEKEEKSIKFSLIF